MFSKNFSPHEKAIFANVILDSYMFKSKIIIKTKTTKIIIIIYSYRNNISNNNNY